MSIKEAVAGIGVVIAGALIVFAAIAVSLGLALIAMLLIAVVPSVLLWGSWNIVAPTLAFIPVEHQHMDFTTVWAFTVLITVLTALVRGSVGKVISSAVKKARRPE